MVSFTALRVKIRQPVYFCQTNALQGRIIWYDAPRFPRRKQASTKHYPVVGFPSGQREQTVNLPSSTSKVRILPPPPLSGDALRSRSWLGKLISSILKRAVSLVLQKELGSRVSGCGHRIMAITSAFQADDAGSIPAARSKRADMAQLVERTLGKGEVPSSTLGISTTSFLSFPVSLLLCSFNKSGMLPG